MDAPKSTGLAFGCLCGSQACVWASLFLGVFLGPFAIREMTGSFALSGLPFAMYLLANLVVLVPAGRAMDRIGRAPVLAVGHGIAGIGAGWVAGSVAFRSNLGALGLVAFLSGLFLIGAGSSVALLTRVPVVDLYPPETRARALGRVILMSFAGSAVGAMIFFGLESRGPIPVPIGYAAMVPIFAFGAAATFLLRGRLPRGTIVPRPRFRPRALVARPRVGVTVAGNTGGWAGMTGIMSIASAALSPLGPFATGAMMVGHFGGMFLPSPVVGWFASRHTRGVAIALGGATLAIGAGLFTLQAVPIVAGIGLALVGAGWCFTFIPGTAILADLTSFEERGTLFGVNDVIVAVAGGVVTILAGFLFSTYGIGALGAFGAGLALLPLAAGFTLQDRRTPSPHRGSANRRPFDVSRRGLRHLPDLPDGGEEHPHERKRAGQKQDENRVAEANRFPEEAAGERAEG